MSIRTIYITEPIEFKRKGQAKRTPSLFELILNEIDLSHIEREAIFPRDFTEPLRIIEIYGNTNYAELIHLITIAVDYYIQGTNYKRICINTPPSAFWTILPKNAPPECMNADMVWVTLYPRELNVDNS